MNIQKSFQAAITKNEVESGKLYLVATPIGNLEDMTFRAVRMLKEADWIAAEDTRQTRKLLTHFEISTRLVSYHEHNKQESGEQLIRKLLDGQCVALVSDAGMPAISDPGYELVKQAVEHDISVIPVPGANAALSALIVSGLPTDSFVFAGFLPREKKKLQSSLEKLANTQNTIILYESPHRIQKTLKQMLEIWGDRQMAMVRELTKKFEEICRGRVSECIEWLEQHPPQGEYCLVIEGSNVSSNDMQQEAWWSGLTVEAHVAHYEEQCGSRKEAMKLAAADRKVSKRDIYNQLI